MRQFESFPKTRYLGSKRKLLPWLYDVFSLLEFESALDAFSGTGAVAYLLKSLGARVTANDTMAFNAVAARALVVNSSIRLHGEMDDFLAATRQSTAAGGFIETTFDGLFYTAEENRFLDRALSSLRRFSGTTRDLLLYCLGQAALSKRPYNLFHRANLNMRERPVNRSFGNKTTWDTPFDTLMRRFSKEVDNAVFDSARPCRATTSDVLTLDPTGYDLVYLDPPYVSQKGNVVDYIDYYHFLEGLAAPESWSSRILHRYRHKPLVGRGDNPWCDPVRIQGIFAQVIRRFSRSQIVISYRSDGIPDIETLKHHLVHVGKRVSVVDAGKYTYALSKNRRSKEVILVGR